MVAGDSSLSQYAVLVVDDEATSRKILNRLLARKGYGTVALAGGGAEALAILRAGTTFDVMLCDLNMPDMDGISLIRAVRSQIAHGDAIAIVVLSGQEDKDTVRLCLEAGADSFLTKPVNQSSVQLLWENIWRKRLEHSMRQRLRQEEETRHQLSMRLTGMERSIESMERKYTEAVDTPIHALVGAIEQLASRGEMSVEVRHAFSVVLRQLMGSMHFGPQLARILDSAHDSGGRGDLDDQTTAWLRNELFVHVGQNGGPLPQTVELRSSGPAAAASAEEVAVDEPKLAQWDFDERMYPDDRQFAALLETFFAHFQLFDRLNIPRPVFREFIDWVRSTYRPQNPYHNFRHAFDVTQACFVILTAGEVAAMLSYQEIFCILVAALTHDLDHTGHNNNFHIQSSSSLAILYNDASVLENHHSSLLWQRVQSHPSSNVFCGLTKQEYADARKLIMAMVLSTDLANHFSIVAQMQAVESVDTSKPEHRALLCRAVVKCGDVSNQCRPWALASRWSYLLQEEFFRQGDLEKKLNLNISPFMDRDKPDTRQLVTNFMKIIALPLFEALTRWIPRHTAPLQAMRENFTRWTDV